MRELAEIVGAVRSYECVPVPGAGAVTGGVFRVSGVAADGPFRLMLKRIRPPEGPRAAAARDPRHFTYWRREALAYRSGLLPSAGLVAPECRAVYEDPDEIRLWTGEVDAPSAGGWPESRYALVARQLGEWQRVAPPAVGWLAGDQLRQRVERTDATGGLPAVGFPDPLRLLRSSLDRLWGRRYELIGGIGATALCHGDTNAGNLFGAPGGGDTVALDWATLGVSLPGFDLAHLVLGAPERVHARNHPAAGGPLAAAHLAALGVGRAAAARAGFAVSYALVAVSRLHWYLARPDPDVPALARLARRALAAVPIG